MTITVIGQINLHQPTVSLDNQAMSLRLQNELLVRGSSPIWHYVVDRRTFSQLVLNDEGAIVYVIDSVTHTVSPLTYLSDTRRELVAGTFYNPGGLLRTQFVPFSEGVVLVYESGVLRIDTIPTVAVRWHQHHPVIDWFFEAIHDSVVWYVSEHDGGWGYRLTNGERVPHGWQNTT